MTWLKRSLEWIKENPGLGTMYKIDNFGKEVNKSKPENKPYISKAPKNKPTNVDKAKHDKGIYAIVCEKAKIAYIGQSCNMSVRIRGHKHLLFNMDTKNHIYIAMAIHLKEHGKDSFEFKKVKFLPEANIADLENAEHLTMVEFVEAGYALYNRQTRGVGNIVCPTHIRSFVCEIIQAIEKDNTIIERIEALMR